MNLGRRDFLRGILGAAAASTKTYAFLGGILRPRRDIVWMASGGSIAWTGEWAIYTGDGKVIGFFKRGEAFHSVAPIVGGVIKAWCKTDLDEFPIVNLPDVPLTRLYPGETMHVVFKDPPFRVDLVE